MDWHPILSGGGWGNLSVCFGLWDPSVSRKSRYQAKIKIKIKIKINNQNSNSNSKSKEKRLANQSILFCWLSFIILSAKKCWNSMLNVDVNSFRSPLNMGNAALGISGGVGFMVRMRFILPYEPFPATCRTIALIIWPSPRAGKMKRILCSDWLLEREDRPILPAWYFSR